MVSQSCQLCRYYLRYTITQIQEMFIISLFFFHMLNANVKQVILLLLYFRTVTVIYIYIFALFMHTVLGDVVNFCYILFIHYSQLFVLVAQN